MVARLPPPQRAGDQKRDGRIWTQTRKPLLLLRLFGLLLLRLTARALL